jgi:uncharacterized protein (DUF1501 family)
MVETEHSRRIQNLENSLLEVELKDARLAKVEDEVVRCVRKAAEVSTTAHTAEQCMQRVDCIEATMLKLVQKMAVFVTPDHLAALQLNGFAQHKKEVDHRMQLAQQMLARLQAKVEHVAGEQACVKHALLQRPFLGQLGPDE